ncbi:EF hand [Opisthorchis viverrini]|uniref:EF hand n=1 Tax=Opisthorchis viverrini TaxID=6198 RepID=A0A1S8X281_OPIVI|nr:EF hand [Opisthorchis viverrini]
MFDRDFSGQIEFNEFVHLVNYVEQWKNCFYRFDRDRSGSIDANEFQMALRTFRYNLSDTFVQYLVRRFDRTHRNVVAFDDFIYACVCLQKQPISEGNHFEDDQPNFYSLNFLVILVVRLPDLG